MAFGRDHDAPTGEQRAERHPVRGAVHERARGQAAGASLAGAIGDLLGRRDLVPDAAATQGAEEGVLGSPHHSLGHAGRAARIEDVEIVGGALVEASFG